ncbi:MAG: hypothetical protein OXR73_22050 [Myxococcales bacterium]|nr:hypothetical protein [Myxococcales bacterium]
MVSLGRFDGGHGIVIGLGPLPARALSLTAILALVSLQLFGCIGGATEQARIHDAAVQAGERDAGVDPGFDPGADPGADPSERDGEAGGHDGENDAGPWDAGASEGEAGDRPPGPSVEQDSGTGGTEESEGAESLDRQAGQHADEGADAETEAQAWAVGRIVFDYVDAGLTTEHLGIHIYHLAEHRLRRIADGARPRAHASGLIAFLQPCADGYRAALIDEHSMIRPVTPCSTDVPTPNTGAFLEQPHEFSYVELSPDGSQVLVSSDYRYGSQVTHETLIFSLEGERVSTFTGGYDSTWTPDGRVLMVRGDNLYLGDLASGETTQIDDGGVLNAPVNNPAVHPSGESIAFEYNGQIWLIGMDGSSPQLLAEANSRLRYPTWSPDGEMLMFTAYGEGSSEVLASFFFYDLETQEFFRRDVDDLLSSLWGAPWGPMTWLP